MAHYNDSKYYDILVNCGAIQRGHFILSSGMHSDLYIQCASMMSNPAIAGSICKDLSVKISEYLNLHKIDIDMCLAPAFGGILVGYEIARNLTKPSLFAERVQGNLCLRRGFSIQEGSNVIITEDVVSTGKSARECMRIAHDYNANIVAVASIINRSCSDNLDGIPLISLIDITAEMYHENEIPDSLLAIPVEKPGSRGNN